MPPADDVGGMEALSVQLIRDAHKADHITDKVARAVAEATHTLCLWAADPAVPDALVAARVTEAVEMVRDIAERVARQRAPRIGEHTQEALAGALQSLQSFLSGSDDDEGFCDEGPDPRPDGAGQVLCTAGDSGPLRAAGRPSVPSPLDPAAMGATAAAAGGGTIVQGGDGSFKRMGVRARSNLLLRTMTPAEKERTMMRACGYMRLLVCGVWLISSLMMLGVGVLAIEAFAKANNGWQKYHSRDFLKIAEDALAALYPALLADNVDIKYTGLSLASQLLGDLSTTRAIGKYSQDKMSFYDAGNRLYEFRAGTQDFTTADQQVTAMLTPRHYASLCRINTSFPLMSTNDAGWMVKSFVIPQLAPYDCANDATPDGVFAEVKPPYITYSPFVRTYRRNPARVCNTYISNFQISVAVTLDWTPIQNLLVSPSTFFGAENLFSFANDVDGWWKRDLVLTLVFMDLVLLGALMLVAQVFTVPALQFRGHRAVFAVALTVTSVVVVVIAYVFVGRIIEDAAQKAHLMRIKNVGRCLASGFTSPVFEQYPAARVAFIQQALAGTLKGNLFFLRGDAGEVYPPDMQSVADAINSQDILLHAYGQTVGRRGGYAYATYAQPGESRVIVMTDTVQTDWVSLSRCKKLIIGMEFAVLVFALVVLYLSPLKGVPLVFASGSALLTHRLQLGLLRQLYFLVLAVTIVVAVAGLNYYGDTLLKEAMTKNAGELMEVLAVTNRASTLVDVCGGSCGFSSYLSGLYFRRGSDNTANYVHASMSLPYSNSENWTDLYLGAQLVMARLPVVVQAMPSFFAPIVNESTNTIHAGSIVRDLAVAVDINATDGFVIERLNPTYGHAGGQYTFVSQSIGLAIVGCMLCVSFTVMEWAYSRLLRLSPSGWLAVRARKDGGKENAVVPHAEGVAEEGLSSEKKVARRRLLRALYVLSASLLLSCAVLISAGVMRGRMRASMEQHADEEMSRVVSGAMERFETVGLGNKQPRLKSASSSGNASSADSSGSDDSDSGVSGGDNPAVMLYNLAVAVADAQDGLESSIAPYVRWRLLQEWPSFGSGRVRVIEGPGDIAAAGDVSTYSPGPLNYGTVPVCGSSEGTWLTPQLPQRKRYCFTEIPGGTLDGGLLPPRNYLLLFTDEESTIVAPVEDAWWELMVASIVVTVALCLAYIVLAWWLLLACDHHDFSPFVCGDLLTVRGAIPRFFRSVDMYIPVRFRKRWAMTTTFGIFAVLLYYCASMQLLFDGVDTTDSTAIAVWTQQLAINSIVKGAVMDAYNYVVAGQPASLTSIQNRATAVSTGLAGYEFLNETRRTELASELNGLSSSLAAFTDLPSLRTAALASSGWDTFQTSLAEEYASYVTAQSEIESYIVSLYKSFDMYFATDFYTDDEATLMSDANLRAQFILVLDTILQLDDYLTQLFILDHVAVGSYLSFDSSDLESTLETLNDNWPFLPPNTDTPSLVTGPLLSKTVQLGAYLLSEIATLAQTLNTNSEAIYATAPSLLSVTKESVSSIQTALPSACVLVSTIYEMGATSMEAYFTPSSLSASTAAAHALWITQESRASEVQYVNNLTMQALSSDSIGDAIASITSYENQMEQIEAAETSTRKMTQLHEYLSRGIDLNTIHSQARWEVYRALVQKRQSMVVALVCATVFYVFWLIACSLWFATRRQQVVWWLRANTSAAALRVGAVLPSSVEERQPLARNNRDEGGVFEDSINVGSLGSSVIFEQTDSSTATGSGRGSGSLMGQMQRSSRRESNYSATAILQRYRHRHVLTIFLLLALLALVPVGLIYWFANHGIKVASANNGVLSMGFRAVDCQTDVEGDVRNLFQMSGEEYAKGNVDMVRYLGLEVNSQVQRLAHTYMWRQWDELASTAVTAGDGRAGSGATTASNAAAPKSSPGISAPPLPTQVLDLIESMNSLMRGIFMEALMLVMSMPTADLPDFHIGLGSYAVSILESIAMTTTQAPNPSNPTGPPVTTTTFSYDDLMPLSTSYGTSAVYTYARYLFTTYTAQAKGATTLAEFQDAVTKYRGILPVLDNIAEAQLLAWHVGIVGARNGGSTSAAEFGPEVAELVSPATLAAMSDSSSEGQAAVTEAQAYFAPLLAVIGTADAIVLNFEEGSASSLPTNQSAAATFASMLTSAGAVSSTLGMAYTEATFQSLYAYNRGLAPISPVVSSIVGLSVERQAAPEFREGLRRTAGPLANTSGVVRGGGAASPGTFSRAEEQPLLDRAVFAFVPSMAPADGSGQLFGNATEAPSVPTDSTSLVEAASSLVAYSKLITQAGVTGVEQYTVRPATRNQWIWQQEVFATLVDGVDGSYGSIEYLYWCIVWCGTCAMWITAIALIYLMYGMELLL